MTVEELRSTDDLRRVNRQMRRRVVKLKFKHHSVVINFAGGLFRARFAGSPDVAFGSDEQQAVQRLRKLLNMLRSTSGIPKACDLAADRAEQFAERYTVKRVKSSLRFNPKRGRL